MFVVVLAATIPRILQAQSIRGATTTSPPEWNVWTSLALGPGTADGQTRVGGDITLWVTRDRLAISIRDAGASRFLEPGDVHDFSVLVGRHPQTSAHVDFVAGLGIGVSGGRNTSGDLLPTEPVIAAGAQLNLNYRVVGIGIDGFASVGDSRLYYGVGLALAVGWFR